MADIVANGDTSATNTSVDTTTVTSASKAADASSDYYKFPDDSDSKCWYDNCDCEDILPGDCHALKEENDTGVGRFACMASQYNCLDNDFIASALAKQACQNDHYIENLCSMWNLMDCITGFLGQLKTGEPKIQYLRNSKVSDSDFYQDIQKTYDLDIYMDSTTGVIEGVEDDGHKTVADQDYKVEIRWCADGTSLNPAVDNTMEFVVYTSAEEFTEDMQKESSMHWQMTGNSDGAMEMWDTLTLKKGEHLKLKVISDNTSNGIFRVHQFKIVYTPLQSAIELPDCLKMPEKSTVPCVCCNDPATTGMVDTTAAVKK